jgi:hypothetical protein
MLFLSFLTALPILLGAPALPGSIRASLPPWVADIWAICLAGGAGLAMLGIYLKRRDWGLILEQVGLALTGVACLVFAGCILAFQGIDGLVGFGIVGGFGAACVRRYFQIQNVLDQVITEERRVRGES